MKVENQTIVDVLLDVKRPSGRRGFDGDQVLNIQAASFGHSDLFSIDKRDANGLTYLEISYQKYWRPFLTLPSEELPSLPNRMDPDQAWRKFPWPMCGTLFPFIALPLVVAIVGILTAVIGQYVWRWRGLLTDITVIMAVAL